MTISVACQYIVFFKKICLYKAQYIVGRGGW
nr:MAG TPA: hypothetical protein [Caudoviricetes sp.]